MWIGDARRGRNRTASFSYDNQGQIIARTEQPTAAFNPDFIRGYYVDPDQAFEEDASGFYHTTLSEQARNAVFGWGNGSGELELTGYVHANGQQVGEASASQTIELKRLTLQVASYQTTDQENGSTSPEVRVKQKKSQWYQKLVMVIIAVIVVAVYTGYIATELFATYGAIAGTVASVAVGYAAGVATSAVTQGLAIAVDLQEDFDWKAAREMGQSFAITAVTAGATSVIGQASTVGQVLARGAVQMGRQYADSGKVTNWSGVALAMVGRSGVSATSNWPSTVSFVNKHRNTLSSGLSVVEKLARGRDVNTLDWTNVAAAAIAGPSGVGQGGRYYNQSGFQWDTIAREALITGGLSLVVGNRFGGDAAANFFGSQLGSMAASAMQEREAYSQPSALEVTEAANEATDAYSQLQGMNRNAERRAQAERNRTRAVADEQQGDAVWQVDLPGELEWRDGQTTAAVFDPSSQVDTGWGSVLGGPDGMSFTNGMRAELSQTTQADFAATEVSAAELQRVLGPVPPGADSNAGGVIALGASETPAFTPSNADSGLQVDYSFLPQQGIDMGEPMTNVAAAVSVDDDPLGVSSSGVDIGPRIGVGDYALTIGGVGWGLVKATATGLWNAGAAIFGPSERLQNLNNLEYAGGIDDYEAYPTEPGLSWEMIGDSLSAQIAQSNENARIARANGDYFSLGMAYSENPLMQMSGLGDLAVIGTLGKFGKLAPNSNTALFTRERVLTNIAESRAARNSSNIDIFHAKSVQIESGYNADDWLRGSLSEGDVIYSLSPNRKPEFFTSLETLQAGRFDSSAVSRALQVKEHPVFGYRPDVTGYRVTQDFDVPFGKTRANPQFGPGGGDQYLIRDFEKHLEPISTIDLKW